jgi:hypothetical protein
MSGRGGTTGRAAGWPARFGRGWGRKGVPGVGIAPGAGMAGAANSLAGDAAAGGGVAAAVRATGGAGIGMDAVGAGPAVAAGGMGCRGPDKIWPGRGDGTGRAGTGPVRSGGCSGAAPPAARGGLKGAGLLRSGSSTMETVASWDVAGGSMPGTEDFAGATGRRSATGSGRVTSSIDSGSATATELSDSQRIATPVPPCRRCRTISATGSSMELEWVFFSETPSSGNMSIMECDGTSSCLASSLIRIFVIDDCNTTKRVA